MNNTSLSPAGSSLLDTAGLPGETEEERRKRLQALQAQQQKIAGTLSPAGRELAMRGYLGGMLQ
jgi:hypothetical protein